MNNLLIENRGILLVFHNYVAVYYLYIFLLCPYNTLATFMKQLRVWFSDLSWFSVPLISYVEPTVHMYNTHTYVYMYMVHSLLTYSYIHVQYIADIYTYLYMVHTCITDILIHGTYTTEYWHIYVYIHIRIYVYG